MHTCVLLIHVLQRNSALCDNYVITQCDMYFVYNVFILTMQIYINQEMEKTDVQMSRKSFEQVHKLHHWQMSVVHNQRSKANGELQV